MDINHDINKTIESLNFLIYEVFDKADIENEKELDNSFSQFNLFYTENEYFANIIQYNKTGSNNLVETAINLINIVHDTLQVMGELTITMEDKDKFHAFTYMSLVMSKAYLYLYKRLEEGTWAVSPIT